MQRLVIGTFGVLLAVMLAAPVSAWKGERPGGVMTIAEVQEAAERGDFVVVEGEIVDVQSGNGNVVIVMLRDATGVVPLRVPNHLQREFAGGGPKGGVGPSGASPQVGRRARVRGQWNHAIMDDSTWGIQVQQAERLGD